MARIINNNAARNVTQQAADTDWQSQAFVNCFLKFDDGSKDKIGTFYLKEKHASSAMLIEALDEVIAKGGDLRTELMAMLEFTYVKPVSAAESGKKLVRAAAPTA